MNTSALSFDAGRDLHPDKPGDPSLQTADEDGGSRASVGCDGPRRRLPRQPTVAPRTFSGRKPPLGQILGSRNPGITNL